MIIDNVLNVRKKNCIQLTLLTIRNFNSRINDINNSFEYGGTTVVRTFVVTGQRTTERSAPVITEARFFPAAPRYQHQTVTSVRFVVLYRRRYRVIY